MLLSNNAWGKSVTQTTMIPNGTETDVATKIQRLL